MESINDRILQVIELNGLNPNSFAQRIQVQTPVIFNIVKGRMSKPSYDLLEKILLSFDNISPEWLLLGTGNMLRNQGETDDKVKGKLSGKVIPSPEENEGSLKGSLKGSLNTQSEIKTYTKSEGGMINEPSPPYQKQGDSASYLKGSLIRPIVLTIDKHGNDNVVFVPVKAAAGYLNGYGDPEYIETLPVHSLPGLHGGTFRGFQVDGWSMFKQDIREGLRPDDWIICRYVDDFTAIQSERVYTIVSVNDGIIVKRVLNRLNDPEEPKLICLSDNKSGDYEPIIIKWQDIKEVWEFKVHLSRFINNPQDLYKKVSEVHGEYIIMQEQIKLLKARLDRIDHQGLE